MSKRVPDLKPRDRLFSHELLRRKMSEVISLRERVAQAELGLTDQLIDHAPLSAVPNEDPCDQGYPPPRTLAMVVAVMAFRSEAR